MAKKEVKRPRRKRGTGTVTERKDRRDGKNWQYAYMVNGKRYTGYAFSYEEADQLVLAAIAEAEKHGCVPEHLTVGEYLEEWVARREHDTHAKSFAEMSRLTRLHYIPAVGHIPIESLTRRMVKKLLIDKWTAEGLSADSVRTYFIPFRAAINDAIEDEIISHDPVSHIRLPKSIEIEDEEEKIVVLTIEQGKAFVEMLNGHWLYIIVLLALATGLRRGELLGLKWRDIDLKKGILHVRRNASFISGKVVEGPPKSKSSRRKVSIPEFALVELKAHRIAQNEVQLGAEDWQDLDLVFCRADGTHIRENTLGRTFDRMLSAAGLPDIEFHKLRHSTVSILLALGVPITVISKILGHANPGVTWAIYAHMLPGEDEEAMQRYNAAW